MSCVSVARAILVRLLFAVHGLVSIWLLVIVTQEHRFWYMASSLGLLLLEMTITLGKKGGKEWKWFCPSVFIYLMCVVPAIWFLELHELHERVRQLTQVTGNATNLTDLAHKFLRQRSDERNASGKQSSEVELTSSFGTVMGNWRITTPQRTRRKKERDMVTSTPSAS